MKLSILIYARNVWQAMDWLALTTGRQDFKVHVATRIIEMSPVKIWVATSCESYERFMGAEFDLILFLHDDCTLEARNFFMTRWKH